MRAAKRNPLLMFIVGDIVAVVCLIVSYVVFRESVGLFTTLLITIAMMPFMVDLMRKEEEETEQEIAQSEGNLLQRHRDVLVVYTAFFTGMIFALTMVYMFLPEPLVEQMFKDQITEIEIIRGNFLNLGIFEKIVINNISVLMLSFLFSFLFGAGAVFILAWNASVLSTAIGLAAKSLGGVAGLPVAVMVFFPHGSLEILAYFIGAIAGGLVSAAITRKSSPKFWTIVRDSLILVGVAIGLLVVAGVIETIAIQV